MKTIIQWALDLALGFVEGALALHAELGEMKCWPAVTAASDLRSYQYRIMRFPAAQTCHVASHALSSAAVEMPCGVLQNNPNSGEPAAIAYEGLSKVWAGAATTARLVFSTNGSGQAIDAVSGSMVVGRMMEAAGAADDRISVLLFPPVRWGSVA